MFDHSRRKIAEQGVTAEKGQFVPRLLRWWFLHRSRHILPHLREVVPWRINPAFAFPPAGPAVAARERLRSRVVYGPQVAVVALFAGRWKSAPELSARPFPLVSECELLHTQVVPLAVPCLSKRDSAVSIRMGGVNSWAQRICKRRCQRRDRRRACGKRLILGEPRSICPKQAGSCRYGPSSPSRLCAWGR